MSWNLYKGKISRIQETISNLFTLKQKFLHYLSLICWKKKLQNWNLMNFPLLTMRTSHVFSFCVFSYGHSFFPGLIFVVLVSLWSPCFVTLCFSCFHLIFVRLKKILIFIFSHLTMNRNHMIFSYVFFFIKIFCFFFYLSSSFHVSFCS